jgi:hypothetical protein
MTRKDYKLIAEAIAATRKNGPADAQGALSYLTGYVASGLAKENPRFSFLKFRQAAGSAGESTEQFGYSLDGQTAFNHKP